MAVFPLLPCKKCLFCNTGNYAQCENYKYFGSRNDGGFQEYLAVPFWNLVFVNNVPLEQAAMIEPATVAQHVINKSKLSIGENIVIFGAGPIGLMVAKWAKISGANDIVIFDVDQTKVNFAKEIGFENVFNNSKKNIEAMLQDVFDNNRPAHVVVEASGNTHAFDQCVQSIGTFGRVILLGNPLSDMTISKNNYDQFMRKEANVIGVFNSVYKNYSIDEWKNTASALEDGSLNLSSLITHKVSFEKLVNAFDMINNNSEFYCKVMLKND